MGDTREITEEETHVDRERHASQTLENLKLMGRVEKGGLREPWWDFAGFTEVGTVC